MLQHPTHVIVIGIAVVLFFFFSRSPLLGYPQMTALWQKLQSVLMACQSRRKQLVAMKANLNVTHCESLKPVTWPT
jgi:hypothetical protein